MDEGLEESLRSEIEELKESNEALRRKVRALQNQLNAHNRAAARQWRDQSDYLPYHEDERD